MKIGIHEVSSLIIAIVTLAEFIVRLTPTKKDDGAVERIGKIIKHLLDFLRIPNKLK